MGIHLGPTLANFFGAQLEKQFTTTKFGFLPAHHCGYIDDIFCVFDCLGNAIKKNYVIKNLHPNLKLTHEIRPRQLSFLDTEIYLPSDIECKYTSKVFRKITNTNVFPNYQEICPWTWKIGLINCFLNTAFNVCSNWSIFHQEISIFEKHISSKWMPIYNFS